MRTEKKSQRERRSRIKAWLDTTYQSRWIFKGGFLLLLFLSLCAMLSVSILVYEGFRCFENQQYTPFEKCSIVGRELSDWWIISWFREFLIYFGTSSFMLTLLVSILLLFRLINRNDYKSFVSKEAKRWLINWKDFWLSFHMTLLLVLCILFEVILYNVLWSMRFVGILVFFELILQHVTLLLLSSLDFKVITPLVSIKRPKILTSIENDPDYYTMEKDSNDETEEDTDSPEDQEGQDSSINNTLIDINRDLIEMSQMEWKRKVDFARYMIRRLAFLCLLTLFVWNLLLSFYNVVSFLLIITTKPSFLLIYSASRISVILFRTKCCHLSLKKMIIQDQHPEKFYGDYEEDRHIKKYIDSL